MGHKVVREVMHSRRILKHQKRNPMSRLSTITVLLLSVSVVGITGCGSKSKTEQAAKSKTADDHKSHSDHKSHEGSDMDKMKSELAKLSPEDQASAEKQHMCVVSGEMLGSMGAPIKLTVKDQDMWICCNSCKQTVLDDPDTYLAKLKK